GEYLFCRRPPRRQAGEFLMRGTEQGRGAKPEDQDGHRQHDGGKQKAKTGEHGRVFPAWPRGCRAVDAKGNAVTTERPSFAAANQADSRISQRLEPVCYKIGLSRLLNGDFGNAEASLPQI